MPEMAQIFTEASCMPTRRIPFNRKLFGPYKGHVQAILGPCFGYLYYIFASRCLKWLKFPLKSHECQLEEYSSSSNYLDHIGALFGPYRGHYRLYLSYISFLVFEMAKFLLKSHALQTDQCNVILKYWLRNNAMFSQYWGNVLAISKT